MARNAIRHNGSAKSDRSGTAREMPLPRWSSDALALAGIAVFWLAMVIVANPRGDFPLNDDCHYAKTVKALLDTGHLKMPHTYTSYLGNIPWGTLFCLPFGFSFMALRISSLTLGLVGSWATYGLIRTCGASRTVAVIGGACVAVNPVYFVLSNTYMTDVPFLVYAAVSGFFLVKGLKTESWLMIAVGTLICCLAAATRTFGLLLPVGYLAVYVWKSGFSIRSLLKGAFPLIIVVVAFLACPSAVGNAGRLFSSSEGVITWQVLQSNMGIYLSMVRAEALLSVTYLGLYCLPLLIVTPWWEMFRFRLPAWLSSEPLRSSREPGKDSRSASGKGLESEYMSKSEKHRQVALMIVASAALVASLMWLASSIIDRIMLTSGGNILYDCGLGPP